MISSPPDLDRRLHTVEEAIARLDRRIGQLEAARTAADVGPAAATVADLAAPADSAPGRRRELAATGAGSFIGRTLVVLGGAFLLRAITESGSLPRPAGLALGFTYGLAWFVAADRVAPRNQRSAVFHGVAALAITVPLLWEAALRFNAIGPWTAALALGLVAFLGLAVSRHRDLAALALVTVSSALIALLALAIGTGSAVPFMVLALVITAASASLPDRDLWQGLRWPAAAVATLLMIALLLREVGSTPLASTSTVCWLSFLYAVVGQWLGPIRLLLDRRPPTTFDRVQTMTAVVLGLGGGLWTAGRLAAGLDFALGLAVLLFAGASYALALALAGESAHRATARLVFNQALVITLIGSMAVFDGSSRALFLAIVGGVFAWTGGRRAEAGLLAHGAAFVVAASLVSGLPMLVARVWFAAPPAWPAWPATLWVVLVAAAVSLLGPRLATGFPGSRITAASRLVLAILLVMGLTTAAVLAAAPGLAGTPAALAAVRGIGLSMAIVICAWAGRTHRGRALGRLVTPLLVVAAVRIVIDDVRHASPMLLFVSLAAYGLSLSLSSRLRLRPDK